MSLYPDTVARCHHIKVNGVQCGSPALDARKLCFFHNQYRQRESQISRNLQRQCAKMTLPVLEDANAIQMELAQIMLLLRLQKIEHSEAVLQLRALRTASINLKKTNFEPEPTRVVRDCKCVGKRPVGVSAWSTVEGIEYDDLSECIDQAQSDPPQKLGEATLDHMLNSVISRAVINTNRLKKQAMSRRW